MTQSSRPRVLTEQDAGTMDTLIKRGESAASAAEQKTAELQGAANDLTQLKASVPAAAKSAADLATAQAKTTLDLASSNANSAAAAALASLATLPKFRSADQTNPPNPSQAELDANPNGIWGVKLNADGVAQQLKWQPHTLAGTWQAVGAPPASAQQVERARLLAVIASAFDSTNSANPRNPTAEEIAAFQAANGHTLIGGSRINAEGWRQPLIWQGGAWVVSQALPKLDTGLLADIAQTGAQAQQAVAVLLTGGGNTAGSVPGVSELRTLNALTGDYAVVQDAQAAYQRQADGTWQAAVSLTPPAPTIRNALPDAAWRVDASRGAVLDVPACRLGRVRVNILARHTDAEADTGLQNVMEIAVYDGKGTKITDSGLWEIPEPGWHEFALRPVNWAGGPLYVVVSSNNTTTARFGDAQVGGITVPLALPAPDSINPGTLASRAPAVSLAPDAPLLVRRPPTYNTMPTAVMGVGSVSGEPYGIDMAERISRSSDGGATWAQQSNSSYNTVMPAGEFVIDMVPWEGSDGTLRAAFLLGHKGALLKYDAGLGTWSLMTPPERHAQAVGRPKNIALWTPKLNEYHLLYGEYTGHNTGEIPDDPYVFRHNLSDPTNGWELSNVMGLSRHVHSFLPTPLGALYVALGDATMTDSDTGIGLRVLAPDDIDYTPLGLDKWEKLTGFFGYTNHYPVDMIELTDANGLPDSLIMSSDRPGIHLLHVKLKGKIGRFNQSALCWQPNSNPGETCHSITLDPVSKNVYYLTGETRDPGLYCSPPPYTRTVKIHDFPVEPTMFRMCIHGGHLMMGNHRWSLVDFLPS